MKKILKISSSVGLCLLAGAIGSVITGPAVKTWYQTLTKPDFTPPNWVFAPVWATLFILMGIAFFLIWDKKEVNPLLRKKAVTIFLIQLIFNLAWSLTFFGLHSIIGGIAVIIILWFLVSWNILFFSKISRTAGLLLVPYIVWVSFAAILNLAFYTLN